jgi:hypothetical protein
VQLNGIAVPVPDLPVGRLVETPTEIGDPRRLHDRDLAAPYHLVARDRHDFAARPWQVQDQLARFGAAA